jgi:peptidoglycan hydrolase-like protein with peptidoglycan-binding domain
MALSSGQKWGIALGAIVATGALAVAASPAQAATPSGRAPVGPDLGNLPPSLPSSTVTQSRPIESGTGADAVTVEQLQLNALGYGPLTVDGIHGPATTSAIAEFLRDYPPSASQRAAYESLPAITQEFYVLDDMIRQISGQPAGAQPSSGLLSSRYA